MTAKQPTAPSHLKAAGRKLWRGVLSEFEIDSTHDLARLQVAAECADRVVEAREAIERDGTYIDGRLGVKAHPAVAVEKDSHALLLRAIREMGVDPAESQPTRPPSRWRGQ